ncbi:HAD family hydrolase [Cupriavidus sp. a3]|uniref:HAD family hydrolase n=1 Tax=Cupriavidus sp. a3 TaxID=3242158 RepID=UPI003D9C36F0
MKTAKGAQWARSVQPRPPTRAVVFDAFGTLVAIRQRRWPFARLVRATADPRHALQVVMTRPLGLREAAQALGCNEVPLSSLEADLAIELNSITLFPEVSETLAAIRALGLKIGIASNLAAPYGEPVVRQLPMVLDGYAWSFQVGFLKPDPMHYRWICEELQVAPEETLMVGDTLAADFLGARSYGLQAVHLDRSGRAPKPDVPTIRTLVETLAWL